jgi:hypothetical protein
LAFVTILLLTTELRKAIDGAWLLGLSGAAALLFGVGIAVYLGAGILALLSMIAALRDHRRGHADRARPAAATKGEEEHGHHDH